MFGTLFHHYSLSLVPQEDDRARSLLLLFEELTDKSLRFRKWHLDTTVLWVSTSGEENRKAEMKAVGDGLTAAENPDEYLGLSYIWWLRNCNVHPDVSHALTPDFQEPSRCLLKASFQPLCLIPPQMQQESCRSELWRTTGTSTIPPPSTSEPETSSWWDS